MTAHTDFLTMLSEQAGRHPGRPALCFLDSEGNEQQWSYGELWNRAVRIAKALQTHQPGTGSQPDSVVGSGSAIGEQQPPRAILLFPPGLDFMAAFVGAQLAGWIAVPTSYPKPYRAMPRLDACVQNCQPQLLLCDSRTLHSLDRSKLTAAADVPALAIDTLMDSPSGSLAGEPIAAWPGLANVKPDDIAFLQYTSGSTCEPKGVMVSQQNLMANIRAIRDSFALDRVLPGSPADSQRLPSDTDEAATAVFWLPHFHDMGLIGGLLTPLSLGQRTVLISPQDFVRRPLRWLRAIQDYRAVVSGAPSFAFELCADRVSPDEAAELDLSSLQVMFCGAEPIRAAALRAFETRFAASGFNAASYYPCYGLAESTLLAAGGKGAGHPTVLTVDSNLLQTGVVRTVQAVNQRNVTSLVSCGFAPAGTELAIVDPANSTDLGENCVGEIWLRGPSVAGGYWSADAEQQSRFRATLVRKRGGMLNWLTGGQATTEGPFYRTGDLGFRHDGQLYIAGRIKDLIIVRGRNYAPQDLEETVATACAGQIQRLAAVPIAGPRGESLGLAVEVARDVAADRMNILARTIRCAVIEDHDIDPREILLVRSGSLPVTTSGKIQRSACRELFTDASCGSVVRRWRRSSGQEDTPIALPVLPEDATADDLVAVRDSITRWMTQWLIVRGGIAAELIDVNQRFEQFGLDSMLSIELLGELEDICGVELTPALAMEHPTIAQMATLAAQHTCGVAGGEGAEQRELVSAASYR